MRPLTQARRTGRVLDSAPVASDKARGVSISSMCLSPLGGGGGQPIVVGCERKEEGTFSHLRSGGYNVPLDTNPFNSWATVLDCGDIPVTSYVFACSTPSRAAFSRLANRS